MVDIRELEARFDARLQAVSARFVRDDNRFIGQGHRLDEIERRHRALDEQATTRLQALDAALGAVDARLEELRERVSGVVHRYEQAKQRADQIGRRTLAAVLASMVLSIGLWSAAVVIVLLDRG